MQDENRRANEEAQAPQETEEQYWRRELTERIQKLPLKSKECMEELVNIHLPEVLGVVNAENLFAKCKALMEKYGETQFLENWKESRKKNLGDNDPLFKEAA